MPSPRSFSASSHDDLHDYDLDGLGGCSFDIINEIDKFLEGLDGADLPETADLEVVNKNNPKSDVEFVGKDSAVFQLLEDHENYGVYEHNPNECNWNVFYKTLPPGEQKFIKVEPKTEIINDDLNTDSENILETFSFNLDNTQEKPIIGEHSSNVISTAADTSEISFYDDVLENFSFKISPSKDDNIKKNAFRKPNPWYRTDSTQRNNVFHHKIKNQYQGNSSLLSVPNNNNNYKKNAFRKPNPWYRKDSTLKNNVKQTSQSHLSPVPFRAHGVVGEGNSSLPSAQSHLPPVPFRAHGVVGEGNSSLPSAQSHLPPVPFRAHGVVGEGNSSLPFAQSHLPPVPFRAHGVIGEENSSLLSAQSHLPPVPFRAHGVVGEYLCPVSLAGTTIKFVSRKLANTSIREQILVELATHGVIENNWWTPDDMFYATFTERNIAKHVFKIYPQNNKNSY
ncbi:uncharacterized protein LOC132934944 isoform X4 [Metopolophium dirhodum]|uniref:uncharacterized protein LOC132934944 isoform X2 n=1 Tax=Metopolophium dirhodum TaxID=44670 RepID=UPI0029907BD7|nr:uncharacterized protein LOC132934944 isoform X2 [Metopolophium dirhodum]XP_060857356.1 uncharacterized protein LOC132934944 isoform X3 [Metopolophium dirhodum]XP_060857357.1 uncharacterized protein LOC132934944 isoform X4 [Metopolophium dirhodum]